MATKITTITITKEMLKNEIEAKNAEIKELKKEIAKFERYEQYREAASDLAALRDSFINAGFTKAEAYELLKTTIANGLK